VIRPAVSNDEIALARSIPTGAAIWDSLLCTAYLESEDAVRFSIKRYIVTDLLEKVRTALIAVQKEFAGLPQVFPAGRRSMSSLGSTFFCAKFLSVLDRIDMVCRWIPIVAITGYGDKKSGAWASEAGAVAFFRTPLSGAQ
jgi:hypothetical protein